MRFNDTVAKKLSEQGFDISFPESDLIPAIFNIVSETFTSEPKTVSFIMNDPDFVGDVLDVLGAI
jgi:hypothetical protein